MKLNNPISVNYNKTTRAVEVHFADGSQASWPVRLLEMTERTEHGYIAINPSDDELAAVELFGEDSILWDELGQIFRIADLQKHIYGRGAWMESLHSRSAH
jgi:hypothetical protein